MFYPAPDPSTRIDGVPAPRTHRLTRWIYRARPATARTRVSPATLDSWGW